MPPSGGFFFMCDVENTTPIYAASQLFFTKFIINLNFIIMLKIKFNSATQIGKAIYVQNVMLNDVLLMSETYLPTSQITITKDQGHDEHAEAHVPAWLLEAKLLEYKDKLQETANKLISMV